MENSRNIPGMKAERERYAFGGRAFERSKLNTVRRIYLRRTARARELDTGLVVPLLGARASARLSAMAKSPRRERRVAQPNPPGKIGPAHAGYPRVRFTTWAFCLWRQAP